MIAVYFIIALLCLRGFGLRKEADGDYLSHRQGDAVKGIFILMVFLNHANYYIREAGHQYVNWYDTLFLDVSGKFGQLIVVMFLFFSGYGVMTAVKNRGAAYVRAMPRRRILTVLLNFDVAVVLFAILQLALGQVFPAKQYLLSLVGWEQIGNSNWYIFVILLCYAATWLSARLFGDGWKTLALTAGLLAVLYGVLAGCKEPYWYNTIVAYPMGMAACLGKERLDGIGAKTYWAALAVSVLCLTLTYIRHQDPLGLVHSFRTVAFTAVMVLLLMKVKVGTPALDWLGKNLFFLYIYQRILMILLAFFDPCGITASRPLLFVLVTFVLTLGLVPVMRKAYLCIK